MLDLNVEPQIVVWAITKKRQWQRCRLAATPFEDVHELSTDEIQVVLDDIRNQFVHHPVIIFTGRKVWERPDFDDIVRSAVKDQLPIAVFVPTVNHVGAGHLEHWKTLGVSSVFLKMDGPVSREGSRAVALAKDVVSRSLRLEIKTVVGRDNVSWLPDIARLVESLGASSWEVNFGAASGPLRGKQGLDAAAMEHTLEWLSDLDVHAPFRIMALGAPQYQRILSSRHPILDAGRLAIKEGRGLVFLDHRGMVFPSDHLPFVAGNVRKTSLSAIYRESPLFCALRDPRVLEGRCGLCAYRVTCGGSRDRAYAATGKLFAEDPGCWDPQSA